MHQTIEFYYDLLSPYSYFCFCRLPGLCKRSSAALLLKPVSLPRLLEGSGNPAPLSVPAKAAYLREDCQRLGHYYGIPFHWPTVHPQRTGRAMSALALLDEGERLEMTRRLFAAIWVEDQDLGDNSVLAELLGAELFEASASATARAQLQLGTQELLQRGGFGVPALWTHEQLFFGNDRLFLLERALHG